MKNILTIAAIVIFASNFAQASNGNNGNVTSKFQVKTLRVKATKLSGFSIKGMQDTKDILLGTQSNDFTTTTTAFAGR